MGHPRRGWLCRRSTVNPSGVGTVICGLPIAVPMRLQWPRPPAWLVRAITGTTQRRQLRDLHAPRHSWASVLEYGVKEGQKRAPPPRGIYGYLLWRGLLPSEAAAVLNLWNKRNEPPIDANELDKIIRSITQREVTDREKRHGRLR